MDLIEATAQAFAMPFVRIRMEDLIADFDARMGKICAALDIEWTDATRALTRDERKEVIATEVIEALAARLGAAQGAPA